MRALATLAWLSSPLALLGAETSPTPFVVGAQLFRGELALDGRISGHERALPQAAVRCANCHHKAWASAARENVEDLGPALGGRTLTQSFARRGGPPSAYTRESFCRLLETGVDPAYVLVQQAMPRYRLASDQCAALWVYLTSA